MIQAGLYNLDCMDAMKEFPDKFFDLAIVDPPYGGGEQSEFIGNRWDGSRFGGRFDKYHIGEQDGRHMGFEVPPTNKGADIRCWDVAPSPEYFQELARISRNQIIWGGNYFGLPPTRCFIVWRKLSIGENFSMAMCEYAWTSFNANAKYYECAPQDKSRFHPTQKPVSLYQFCLKHFSKDGDKIIDTHAGSASSLVACHRAGLECWGFEIDKVYYDKAKERLEREMAQQRLF